MNKWTEVFSAMLDLIEMELTDYEDGYGLIDLQGANLGDIESDRFTTAEEIIDRIGVYLNDYYYDDLENEAYDQALMDAFMEVVKVTDGGFAVAWQAFAEKWKGDPEVDKFVQDHQHEFDVMEMIVNHLAEVDLDDIMEQKA